MIGHRCRFIHCHKKNWRTRSKYCSDDCTRKAFLLRLRLRYARKKSNPPVEARMKTVNVANIPVDDSSHAFQGADWAQDCKRCGHPAWDAVHKKSGRLQP